MGTASQNSTAVTATAADSRARRRPSDRWHGYSFAPDYFPGFTGYPTVDAGQFLYPSAYGYGFPARNEYTASVNPYFPGLAYSQFAYPIVYSYGSGFYGGPPANPNPAPVTEPQSDETGAGEPLPQPPQPANRARGLPGEPNSVLEAVQIELLDRGYFVGTPDGLQGPATAEAIRRFQTDQRLRPTGKVNQATLFALGLN